MEKKLSVKNREDGVVLHGHLFYDENSKKGLILFMPYCLPMKEVMVKVPL